MRLQITSGSKLGYLDIEGNEPAMFNMSVNDIKDVSKLAGAYSNTINIVNTKETQEILGHIFSVAVEPTEGAIFDRRKKIKCALVDNGEVFKDNLNMKLKEVKVNDYRVVGYSVELYDDTTELFNQLNSKYLTDLDFSDGDHTLSKPLIHNSFGYTSVDSLWKYHLTSNTGASYNIRQFKPAIFTTHYIQRIAATNGIQIEIDNDPYLQIDKYIQPCTRKKLDMSAEPVVIQERLTDTGIQQIEYTVPDINQNGIFGQSQKIIFDSQIFDPEIWYNDGTGNFEPSIPFSGNGSLLFRIEFEAELKLYNTTGDTLTQEPLGSTSTNDKLCMRLYANPVGGSSIGADDSQPWIEIPRTTVLTPFELKTIGTGTGSAVVSLGNVNIGDQIEQRFASVWSPSGRFNRWVSSPSVEEDVIIQVVIKSARISIEANTSAGYLTGSRIKLNNFVPEKVKQSDLLKAVCTINNAWLISQGANSYKLVRRNKYLREGDRKDWTKKFQHKAYTLSDISGMSKKEMLLTYKNDKGLNETYTDAIGEVYGQQIFRFDTEHQKGVEKIEIPFASTPLEPTVFGAIVPSINGANPAHEPRILIDGGVLSCSDYEIKEGSDTYLVTDGYPFLGHWDHPYKPTFDINFGVCDYYFYDTESLTNNNAFNLNWRSVCNQINKGTMLKGTVDLSISDIYNLSYNDKLHVMGKDWHINTLKANLNRKVGASNYLAIVELISSEEVEELPIRDSEGGWRPTTPNRPDTDEGNAKKIRPSYLTNEKLSASKIGYARSLNNWHNEGGGMVEIIGKDNTIMGTVDNALIVGDGIRVEGNGIITQRANINDVGEIHQTPAIIRAGKDVVLNYGGANVPYQAVDAGKDVVLDYGGTKNMYVVDGNKTRIQHHSISTGSFTNEPNTDYSTFSGWDSLDLAGSEIGVKLDTNKLYINYNGTIIELT